MKLISSDEDRARIERLRDFDCSWGMPGVGRFRVNVLRQRSSFMIVMRVIPFTVPTLESLRLPEALAQMAESERGLVLVTGVSGSGKSSTVAAMVHHINRTQQKHVVTIENPIEFLHRDLSCSITQREVGVDTESIVIGLRAALRQDPDVVVLGEMADAETIDTAIKAAETGHLVIATMPTADVVATVERVIAALPAEEREVGRMRFAEALRAIVSQQLLPEKKEKGRVPAVEVLLDHARRCGTSSGRLGVPPRSSSRWPTAASSSAARPTSSTWTSWSRAASSPPRPPRPRMRSLKPSPGTARRQARRQAGVAAERARHDRRALLAQHREAGTPEAERARELVAAHLTELGYRVTRQRFRFHPSALLGFPIFGAGVGAAALLALPLLTLPAVAPAGCPRRLGRSCSPRRSVSPSGVAAGWLTMGEAREDANLIAVRSDAPYAAGSWRTSTPRRRLTPWRAGWWPSGCSPWRSGR